MPISALIADDEASARSRLRKMLAPYSFELIERDARDGLEALEAIRKHRPQVVFLDVEMPGLGGFEVVESLDAGDSRSSCSSRRTTNTHWRRSKPTPWPIC